MLEKTRFLIAILAFLTISYGVKAQQVVNPTKVSRAVYFDKIESFKKLPTGKLERGKIERNAKLKERLFPNKGNIPVLKEDPVWQKTHGKNKAQTKAPLLNFNGQNTSAMPSDCNGEIGLNYFFQGVNSTLAIYDKGGTLVAGPTDYNTLFAGVTGATRNDGDPIVLYDSEAGRWLAAEFSLGKYYGTHPYDYMLIAISETSDPTGAWYRWSFEMKGMPDYMKFGVWQDGYYMATNTEFGDDIYVFERDVMIAGGASPQMIQFDNPNRPLSGFFTLQPLDNDGTYAPVGTPGQFITIKDNAWVGTDDELWIFECDVDWTSPANSTFARTQQIRVSDFDSDFGSDWENIAQPGTSQELDGIPQILMYKVQYRNFGSTQSIVCVHAVDVDNSDHAGLRWYELEKNGKSWFVRQEGTYAPDEHSRWLASIAMNGKHEIAIGYSISSSTEYPGIRYVGQSADENSLASGVLDIPETNVHTGTKSQTGAERWGDYSLLSVDPQDDHTFWFTTEYVGATTTKSSKIVGFEFSNYNYPISFSATAVSQSQIDLSWRQNDASNNVLIAYSDNGTFGTPVNGQTYSANDAISGGGTVLYAGPAESFNHNTLNGATRYYYKAWSILSTTPEYSSGVYTNAKTLNPPPTNHITNFVAETPVDNSISLTWTDASTGTLPDGYIIKVSGIDYAKINDPVDRIDEANDTDLSDGNGSYKVSQGIESYTFSNLDVLTTYYFKIFPFTNSGSSILYKTDGTVPETQATTPLSYCSSTYTDTGDDWITNVTVNTINNTTGQDGADSYGDYTYLSTDLEIGNTYELSVSFSSSGYTEHVIAWIDWDRNGSFDDLSEAYDLGNGVDATLTTNITVPEDAFVGEIRMRVIEEYDEDPSSCGNGVFGETEDYTLNILSDCPPPSTQARYFSLDNVTDNSMGINWVSGSQQVLIIANEGSAISTFPSNSTTYLANNTYGTIGTEFAEGYVVFNGVGENVTVTNLQKVTDYYYTIYTYDAVQNCYNKTSPLNGKGTTYGEATVTATTVSDITATTATASGEVTDDNGLEVTEKGIVYATTTSPTVDDTKVTATETGEGNFSVQLSSLNLSMEYFVRAYAINSAGTSYGNEVTFRTTDGLATVITGTITGITANSATVAGQVTDDEGLDVTEKGIVYATTTTPTVDNNKVVATETGLGSFSVQLSSLNPNTNYYARAYAINSAGTSYGNEETFKTDEATGIEALINEQVKIYPNPNGGSFTLSIPLELKSAKLELTDVNGNVVLKKTLNSTDTDIDITNEANGIYFLKIHNKGQFYSKKIIKK